MTSVAIANKDAIIRAISQGQTLDSLNLGVSRQALAKALKDDTEYQAAMIEYHAARLDKAEKMIEESQDQVDVARARALHGAYSWRAEREQRATWGKDTQNDVTQAIQVVINR